MQRSKPVVAVACVGELPFLLSDVCPVPKLGLSPVGCAYPGYLQRFPRRYFRNQTIDVVIGNWSSILYENPGSCSSTRAIRDPVGDPASLTHAADGLNPQLIPSSRPRTYRA